MSNDKPRFEHDCDSCKFLGRWKHYDLWVCPNQSFGGDFIARKSSEGPAYSSYDGDTLATGFKGLDRLGLNTFACMIAMDRWEQKSQKEVSP